MAEWIRKSGKEYKLTQAFLVVLLCASISAPIILSLRATTTLPVGEDRLYKADQPAVNDVDALTFDSLKDEPRGYLYQNDISEIVIGLEKKAANSHSRLISLIIKYEGTVTNDICVDGNIEAVVVEMPQEQISLFEAEVQRAGLSRYVEPNRSFRIDGTPNDPYWSQQWGASIIEADFAWNTTMGDQAVLVAIIDTGVDWNHPDLSANYVPLGRDWVNDDSDPMDDNGHGTHCAGIVAAVANNGIGTAGLAQVRLMAEKGLDHDGIGWEDDLANSIIHSVDNGADILSCSWGGLKWTYSQLVHEAIRYAYSKDVLVIASAGNDGQSLEWYPAAYEEVVAVAATNKLDMAWTKTNFGEWVELSAPGVGIYSTFWDDSYGYMSGTSMSAPYVAGVASLAWSRFPYMTRDQVRAQLRESADDLGDPGPDLYFGYGRVNARKAVEQIPDAHDLFILDCKVQSYVRPESSAIVNVTVLNFGAGNENDIEVQLFANDSLSDFMVIGSLQTGKSVSLSLSWRPAVEGAYNVTCYIVPAPGESTVKNNAFSDETACRTPGVMRVPQDYEKIQEAIDAAISGDTVFVASGIYHENLLIDKQNLTIVGESQSDTIIEGDGKATVVQVTGDSVKLAKLTIRNGGTQPQYLSDCGLLLHHSKWCMISDTEILDNRIGLCIQSSSECTLRNNNIAGNEYNFGVLGSFLFDFMHDIDASNSVDGKPVCYYVNKSNERIQDGAGYVAVINSTGILGEDLALAKNLQGLLLAYTEASTVRNVSTSYNEWGILLVGSHTNQISGNNVSENRYSIDLWRSNGNSLYDNSLSKGEDGLYLEHSNNNTIEGNIITSSHSALNQGQGLLLESSAGNIIRANSFADNDGALHLSWSGHNVLGENNMSHNLYSFGVTGNSLSHFLEDIDASNSIDKKPIYYLIGKKDLTIDASVFPEIGFLGIINSTNVMIRDFELTGNIQGLLLAFVTDSLINNVTASNNIDGISVQASSENVIQNTSASHNRDSGIYLYSSNKNTLASSVVLNNSHGIQLQSSTGNIIENVLMTENSVCGVRLSGSSNNTIVKARIEGNLLGICAESSSGNFIFRSAIEQSRQYGVTFEGCSGNSVCQNNFINNKYHVLSFASFNVWDMDGKGNYWKEYNVTDLNDDHIGDEPYTIDEKNVDNYPLVYPFRFADLNGDNVVDIVDLAIVAKAYGSHIGEEKWNQTADLDNNAVVDILDIAAVAKDYENSN